MPFSSSCCLPLLPNSYGLDWRLRERVEAVRPGDIILVRTGGTFYKFFRSVAGHGFDHLVCAPKAAPACPVLMASRVLRRSSPRARAPARPRACPARPLLARLAA